MSEDPLRLYARFHAELNGLNPDDYEKQLDAESSFNPSAVSPKGARGVAQFMPATGKQYGLNTPDDLHDPIKSIRSGAKYMADLKAQANGDEEAARVGYNAGPRAMQRFQRGGRIPSETSGYIKKIDGDDPESLYEKFRSQLKTAAPTRADAADGTAGRVPAVASPSSGVNIAGKRSLRIQPEAVTTGRQFNIPSGGFQQSAPQAIAQNVAARQAAGRRLPAKRAANVPAVAPHSPYVPADDEITAEQSRMLGPGGTRATVQSQEQQADEIKQYGAPLTDLQREGARYLRSLPKGDRKAALQKLAAGGRPIGDEEREAAGVTGFEKSLINVGAPIMKTVAETAAGAFDVPQIPGVSEQTRLQGAQEGLRGFAKEMDTAENIAGGGPLVKFGRAAAGTAPLLAMPGGMPAFVVQSYLQAKGEGADDSTALKHAATTAAGLYAGGKLSQAFEKEVEGTVERYFARSAGIGAGLTGASAVAGEPQSLESLGHTAGMSLLFGLPHGAGEKPGSEASRRAPAGAVEQRGAADVSTGQSPSELVPEPLEAITAQLEALRAGRGNRRAVLVPTDDQMPVGKGELTAQGLTTTKTPAGTFVHISDPKNPLALSHAAVRWMVADGSYHEALGLIEPKSRTATEAVTARNEKGTEFQTAMTSPENIPAQAEEFAAQHPEAKIAVEPPEKVIADRVATVPQQSQGRYRLEDAELVEPAKPVAEAVGEGKKSNKPTFEHDDAIFRVQDSRHPLPNASTNWRNVVDEPGEMKGVSAFVDLHSASDDLLGGKSRDEWGGVYSDAIKESGGEPVLSLYKGEIIGDDIGSGVVSRPSRKTELRVTRDGLWDGWLAALAKEFPEDGQKLKAWTRTPEGWEKLGEEYRLTDFQQEAFTQLKGTKFAKPAEPPKAEAGPSEPDLHPANYQPRDSETQQFIPGKPEYPAEDMRRKPDSEIIRASHAEPGKPKHADYHAAVRRITEGDTSPEYNDFLKRIEKEFGVESQKRPAEPIPEDAKATAILEGKERALPKTLDAAQLEGGQNRTYQPTSILGGSEAGREIVKEKGVDGAIEHVLHGDAGIEWASTGYAAMEQLRADEAKVRISDAAAADEIQAKRLKFVGDFAAEATKRGQAIAGIRAIEEFAPDRAVYIANTLSQGKRKRGLSPDEEARIAKTGEDLQVARDRIKSLEAQLEAQAATKKRSAKETKKANYQSKLEEQGATAKQALAGRLANLDFGNLGRPGERGAVKIGEPPLPGDAELIAQYAASRLAKLNTAADLNAELTKEFGAAIEPHLPAIRRRALSIREEARLAEIKDSEPERRRTILQEIQQEVTDLNQRMKDAGRVERIQTGIAEKGRAEDKASREAYARKTAQQDRAWDKQEATAERERDAAAQHEQRARARQSSQEEAQAKRLREAAEANLTKLRERRIASEQKAQAREAERVAQEESVYKRRLEAEANRERLVHARKESVAASKAAKTAYRTDIRTQREAARKAELWDTPLREDADDSRMRLANADPKAPETLDDLVSVATEMLLPAKAGGAPRGRSVIPGKFYVDLKAQFPDLVTRKNQGQIYKRAYQRVRDMTKAAREASRLASASKEERRLWNEAGIDADAQALLIQRAEAQRQQQDARSQMTREFNRVSRSRLGKIGFELQALPRALQSSIDAPIGRQGLFYLITHPIETARFTIPATVKGYAASREGYHQLVADMQKHPDYRLAEKAGVDLPGIASEVDPRVSAEEPFQSTAAERLFWVRLSEQGFTHGMNAQRLAAFSRYADFGRASGYTWESNPEFFQQAAQYVNAATGRGNMPETLKRATALTNALFYSTRLQVSRVQLLNNLLNPVKYVKYDPAMRKIAAGEAIRLAAGMALILGTAKATGLKVTTNPDDPDFGKVVWGKIHYDLTAGEGALIRTVYRLVKATAAKVNGEKPGYKQDTLDILWDFTRKKLAPWPGAAVNLLAGKDVVGHPANVSFANPEHKPAGQYIQDVQDQNQIVRMVAPMVAGDFIDAANEEGWVGVAKTVPGLGGVGIQAYDPDKPRTSPRATKAATNPYTQAIERYKRSLRSPEASR